MWRMKPAKTGRTNLLNFEIELELKIPFSHTDSSHSLRLLSFSREICCQTPHPRFLFVLMTSLVFLFLQLFPGALNPLHPVTSNLLLIMFSCLLDASFQLRLKTWSLELLLLLLIYPAHLSQLD